jgi:hypothetical protein
MQNPIIDEYGTIRWCSNGKLHRVDGPAREWADGDKEWYRNGIRHREDGPAVIYRDGAKSWWLHGKEYTEDLFRLTQFNNKFLVAI